MELFLYQKSNFKFLPIQWYMNNEFIKRGIFKWQNITKESFFNSSVCDSNEYFWNTYDYAIGVEDAYIQEFKDILKEYIILSSCWVVEFFHSDDFHSGRRGLIGLFNVPDKDALFTLRLSLADHGNFTVM